MLCSTFFWSERSPAVRRGWIAYHHCATRVILIGSATIAQISPACRVGNYPLDKVCKLFPVVYPQILVFAHLHPMFDQCVTPGMSHHMISELNSIDTHSALRRQW